MTTQGQRGPPRPRPPCHRSGTPKLRQARLCVQACGCQLPPASAGFVLQAGATQTSHRWPCQPTKPQNDFIPVSPRTVPNLTPPAEAPESSGSPMWPPSRGPIHLQVAGPTGFLWGLPRPTNPPAVSPGTPAGQTKAVRPCAWPFLYSFQLNWELTDTNARPSSVPTIFPHKKNLHALDIRGREQEENAIAWAPVMCQTLHKC